MSSSDADGEDGTEDVKPSTVLSGDVDDDKPDALADISDPRETDVLCGRGGAALRHPGNQT